MSVSDRRRPHSRPRTTNPVRMLHTGAAFGLADAPGAVENTFEETTLIEIALTMRAKLAARGITTELADGSGGPELHGTNTYEGMILPLDKTAFELAGHSRSKWNTILDVRVAQTVSMTACLGKPLSTAEQWRAAVRTRLIDPDEARPGGGPVYRPFAGNLVLGLYRRFDGGVHPVVPALLGDCPLTIDELFEAGQRNTDEAPVVHSGPIGAGAWALHGEGFFTASKAPTWDGSWGRSTSTRARACSSPSRTSTRWACTRWTGGIRSGHCVRWCCSSRTRSPSTSIHCCPHSSSTAPPTVRSRR